MAEGFRLHTQSWASLLHTERISKPVYYLTKRLEVKGRWKKWSRSVWTHCVSPNHGLTILTY